MADDKTPHMMAMQQLRGSGQMSEHPRDANEGDAWFDPVSEIYYAFKDGAWVENNLRHYPEYSVIADVVTTHPTMNLRWNDGVLQQGFVNIHMRGAQVVKQTDEWRNVPTEQDNAE